MNKAELLERAKELGFLVNTETSKDDLVSMLKDSDKTAVDSKDLSMTSPLTQSGDTNANGEKTNGTTKDGSTEPVTNETSVPQNGKTTVETTGNVDNPVTTAADKGRTENELRFADEGNPNQKRRDGGAPGEEFDQDGNSRTGGYSYGVSSDDVTGTVSENQNKGVAPDKTDRPFEAVRQENMGNLDYLNNPNSNNEEWSVKDQQKLADSLSDKGAGISAGISTSAGNYVRVKFFYNNKALGTYVSRDFKVGDAKKFLSELRKSRGL